MLRSSAARCIVVTRLGEVPGERARAPKITRSALGGPRRPARDLFHRGNRRRLRALDGEIRISKW